MAQPSHAGRQQLYILRSMSEVVCRKQYLGVVWQDPIITCHDVLQGFTLEEDLPEGEWLPTSGIHKPHFICLQGQLGFWPCLTWVVSLLRSNAVLIRAA